MTKTTISKVRLDMDKLSEIIKEKDRSLSQLSLSVGKGYTYLSDIKKRGTEVPVAIEKLLCIELDIEPGSLVLKEPELLPDAGVIVFERLYKKLEQQDKRINVLIECIEKTLEEQEKIYNKLSAQTLTLARIKDILQELSKTDVDKAKDFLKNLLSSGAMMESDIVRDSQKASINQSALALARKELDIQVSTKGYGSSQKKWWSLPR